MAQQEVVRENKMGTMPEGKLLITMSLPMMISMFVQAMYNIVDSIFVGRLSPDALGAVSIAFPLQSLMIAIGAGTGVGVNALISRGLGEKNQEKVNKVAANGVFVYILSYLVVLLASFFVVKPFCLAQIEPGKEIVAELGTTYLTIVMALSFGIFAQFVFERMLQATGRTMLTMISQLVGAVINIILDPILIFGLIGFPKMGIAGAAVATVIGQICAGVLAYIFNRKYNSDVHFTFKGFKPDGAVIGEIYKIGIPSIVMQSIGSVMTFGMNKIFVNVCNSQNGVTIFGTYFKLQSFFFMPIFGLNNGIIPIVSYNYGAKNKKRMMNTMRYGYIIAAFFCLIGLLSFELVPDKLLMLFSLEGELLDIGCRALRVIAFHYLIAWYCIVTGTLFQAVGSAVYSLYVSVARQLLVLLPAAYLLAYFGGIEMIWWSFPIAEIMSAAISTLCFGLVKKRQLSDF